MASDSLVQCCEPVLHGFPPGSLHSFFVFALHHVNTCHRASSHQRACKCLQQKCLQTCIRQTTEFFLLPVLYLFIFTLFHFHILSPIPIPPERSWKWGNPWAAAPVVLLAIFDAWPWSWFPVHQVTYTEVTTSATSSTLATSAWSQNMMQVKSPKMIATKKISTLARSSWKPIALHALHHAGNILNFQQHWKPRYPRSQCWTQQNKSASFRTWSWPWWDHDAAPTKLPPAIPSTSSTLRAMRPQQLGPAEMRLPKRCSQNITI